MYHITVGEGHRCGEGEADGYEVGRSALLKLMQSCCRCDLFREPNATQMIVTMHTYQQTVELWSLFSSDLTPSIYSYLDALLAVQLINVNDCPRPLVLKRG